MPCFKEGIEVMDKITTPLHLGFLTVLQEQNAYIGGIEYCDQHIGKLIDEIKRLGLYDNSLIVFTSDHGEEFHEHGGWWHGLSPVSYTHLTLPTSDLV